MEDERGFFARTFCQREFKMFGLDPKLVQCNISFNLKKGTLRGVHYQTPPYEEAKLIRCTSGAIYDVIIDLRSESESYKQWIAVKLTAENRKMIYVPKGFAHGFQTLQDNTEVFYQIEQFYSAEHGRGIRWDDPSFNIEWPETEERIISKKDQTWSDYRKL